MFLLYSWLQCCLLLNGRTELVYQSTPKSQLLPSRLTQQLRQAARLTHRHHHQTTILKTLALVCTPKSNTMVIHLDPLAETALSTSLLYLVMMVNFFNGQTTLAQSLQVVVCFVFPPQTESLLTSYRFKCVSNVVAF